MKIRIQFKTPDATHYALEDVPEEMKSEAEDLINRFVRYDEYLTVEFDTEANTAIVVENGKSQ